jgi:hypothetical protein
MHVAEESKSEMQVQPSQPCNPLVDTIIWEASVTIAKVFFYQGTTSTHQENPAQ